MQESDVPLDTILEPWQFWSSEKRRPNLLILLIVLTCTVSFINIDNWNKIISFMEIIAWFTSADHEACKFSVALCVFSVDSSNYHSLLTFVVFISTYKRLKYSLI